MTFAVRIARTLKNRLQTADILDVVEQLGIIYEVLPLPQRIKGFTGMINGRSYIAINDRLSAPWARAVAFHELGHIQLHKHMPDQLFVERYTLFPVSRLERQANAFAAEYLIPDEALTIHSDIRVVAAELGVPVELFQYKRPPRGGLCCM